MPKLRPVERVTAEALQTLLAQLQPQDEITPNAVGNLMIIRADAYLGYIDLGHDKGLRLDA